MRVDEAWDRLDTIPMWKLTIGGLSIVQRRVFSSFEDAFQFVQNIVQFCQPSISLMVNNADITVTIELTTWHESGLNSLTNANIDTALKIDNAFGRDNA